MLWKNIDTEDFFDPTKSLPDMLEGLDTRSITNTNSAEGNEWRKCSNKG